MQMLSLGKKNYHSRSIPIQETMGPTTYRAASRSRSYPKERVALLYGDDSGDVVFIGTKKGVIHVYFMWLVVWNMTFIFHISWGIIIPIDFHIFQRGWNQHPVI